MRPPYRESCAAGKQNEEIAIAGPASFGLFTEYGPHGSSHPPGDDDYLRFIQGIGKYLPRAVFFMSWNAKWSLASNNHAKELLDHPWIVNREDLPAGLAGTGR